MLQQVLVVAQVEVEDVDEGVDEKPIKTRLRNPELDCQLSVPNSAQSAKRCIGNETVL